MKLVIHRHEIDFGLNRLELPYNSEIISAGFQPARHAFSVWYRCPADIPPAMEGHEVLLIPTGEEFTAPERPYDPHVRWQWQLLSSIVMPDDFSMFHAFKAVKG